MIKRTQSIEVNLWEFRSLRGFLTTLWELEHLDSMELKGFTFDPGMNERACTALVEVRPKGKEDYENWSLRARLILDFTTSGQRFLALVKVGDHYTLDALTLNQCNAKYPEATIALQKSRIEPENFDLEAEFSEKAVKAEPEDEERPF